MKRLLLLAFLLCPSLAWASCGGTFSAQQVCGTTGGGVPGPIPFTAIASSGAGIIINGTTATSGFISGDTIGTSGAVVVDTKVPYNNIALTTSLAQFPSTVVLSGNVATAQGTGTKLQLSKNGFISGDIVVFDATGNTSDSGSSSAGGGTGDTLFQTPAGASIFVPSNTTSSFLTAGLGSTAATSASSGGGVGTANACHKLVSHATQLQVVMTITFADGGINGAAAYELRTGTGGGAGAPRNGGAIGSGTGNVALGSVHNQTSAPVANDYFMITLAGGVSGLTPGITDEWFDVAYRDGGGVNALTIQNAQCTITPYP